MISVRILGVLVLVLLAIVQAPARGAAAVDAMIREAENLAYFEAFKPAKRLLERAVRASTAVGDTRLTALALDRLGSVLDFVGETAAGAARHREALTLANGLEDRATIASITASIGLAHWRRSGYDDALRVLQDALALQERIGDVSGAARTRIFIGRVHFKRGAYDAAEASYLRAHQVLERGTDPRWLSIALEDLGHLSLERGAFAEALDTFEKALDARTVAGDAAGEAYMQAVIGRAYTQQGAYHDALARLTRAAALSDSVRTEPTRAHAVYHMGIAYEGLGEYARALDLYRQALHLKEGLGDRRQQVWILSRIGDVHAVQRNRHAALDAYHHAIAISDDIGDPVSAALVRLRAGQVSLELGDHEGSLDSFRRASGVLAASQPGSAASAQSGLARAFAAGGHESLALGHARRAVEYAQAGSDEARWGALRTLASVERQFGHRIDALAHFRGSLSIIESMRERGAPVSDVREKIFERKQAVYGDTVQLLVDLGHSGEALEVAERARRTAFVDLLSGRAATARTPAGPLTLEEMRQEARRRGATIVEYLSTADRLFTWVLQPNGKLHGTSSRSSRADLTRRVDAVRAALASGEEVRVQLRQLYDILIAPVAPLLPSNRDDLVTIVPHGPLFALPFGALLDAGNRYVIEDHTLSYSPSVSVLPDTAASRDRAAAASARVLTVGNPVMPGPRGEEPRLQQLPGGEREARALRTLYPQSRVTALAGPSAAERTIRDLAPDHTVIHFATHAMIFDAEPMASYLALSADAVPDSERQPTAADGFLTLSEILRLHLRADVVSLSACNPGKGRISGEGIEGFSQAFLYAGAATVVVNLWPVADDADTAQLKRFYEGLTRRQTSKAVALADAQRETIAALRAGRLSTPAGLKLEEHPGLWAPFVIAGEAR